MTTGGSRARGQSLVAWCLAMAVLSCGGDTSEEGGISPEDSASPAGCRDHCGPTTEHFFENSHVATLRISVDSAYLKEAGYEEDEWEDLLWERWNSHCGPYDWVPVRIEYESPDGVGNDVLDQVGMRLRGSKSRGQNLLAGFKLDFDKLTEVKDRRFADLNRLELLSNEGDNTNMLQCMSYKLLRDFGLEAPRCNHLQVYINGTLYGLMESVERAKDRRFLRHHFGTNQGFLYGASESCGYADALGDLEYKGDTFSDEYAASYEILVGSADTAQESLIPMFKCGDDEATPDDEEFAACIADWIDVDQWLRLIAAESLMPSVEDFVGARRNFFLYFHPDESAPHGGRLNVWGWDYDTSLQTATCYPRDCDPFTSVAGWYGPRGRRAKLLTRLTRVFKQRYCELGQEFLASAYDPEKVREMATTIEPFMQEDPVLTSQTWKEAVETMHAFMAQHHDAAREALALACQP